jgi:hypothetical protein
MGRCILLIFAFGFAFAEPAAAQGLFAYPGYSSPLPPQEVMAIVRSTGLQPLGRPERQGPTYGVRALNRAGQEVRVIVDARMGRILKVIPLAQEAAAPPYDRPPGAAMPDPYGPNPRLGAVPPPPYGPGPYDPGAYGPGTEPEAPPPISGAARSPQLGAAPAARPKPKPEQPKSEQSKSEQAKPQQSKPAQGPAVASGDDKLRLAEPPLTPSGEPPAALVPFDE